MFEVQIKTPLPESCCLGGIKEVLKTSVAKIEGLSRNDESIKGLLSIKTEEVENILDSLPSFCEGFVSSSQEATVLIREHTCFLALAILESGCLITNAELDEDEVVWNIICDEESFLDLMKSMERSQIEFEILYKGRPDRKSSVTYREEEILRMALEKGYFDFPKRIRLDEMAKNLGMASSTLSEILRRGEKKVLMKYFGLK